ncbi:hypothetical protein NE237_015274 [Protea cynaroides]|uniref:Alliinase C-terminal domain-containing protein n=1 Tax=Protea cynaroides TaxID=273540 RepID=A0A9Q0KDJ4_9MAGN|nr:hypothetical protein NE237_015274 [Protea cynaroides]
MLSQLQIYHTKKLSIYLIFIYGEKFFEQLTGLHASTLDYEIVSLLLKDRLSSLQLLGHATARLKEPSSMSIYDYKIQNLSIVLQHIESNMLQLVVTVSGWHRMSYSFVKSSILPTVGNVVTVGNFVVFGLNASLYALSDDDWLSKPDNVVALAPYYSMYQEHATMFKTRNLEWQGVVSNISNNSTSKSFIEIVTSPNKPDSKLRYVLQCSFARIVYDHAYYWPHYSAIPAPVNRDLMIFTLLKITSHAGVSQGTQVQAFELLQVILEDEGKALFKFGYKTIANWWEKLNKIIYASKYFSLQKLSPQYCNYFQDFHQPSPEQVQGSTYAVVVPSNMFQQSPTNATWLAKRCICHVGNEIGPWPRAW